MSAPAGLLALGLLGGMIGFAPFNRPVARLFLGDVGSLPVGLLMAYGLFDLASHGGLARRPHPAAALLHRRQRRHAALAAPAGRPGLGGASAALLPGRDGPAASRCAKFCSGSFWSTRALAVFAAASLLQDAPALDLLDLGFGVALGGQAVCGTCPAAGPPTSIRPHDHVEQQLDVEDEDHRRHDPRHRLSARPGWANSPILRRSETNRISGTTANGNCIESTTLAQHQQRPAARLPIDGDDGDHRDDGEAAG